MFKSKIIVLMLTAIFAVSLSAAAPAKAKAPAEKIKGLKASTTAAPRQRMTSWHWRFEEKRAIAARDGKKVQAVFIGDSITHFWDSTNPRYNGKGVFDKEFAGYNILNLGYSGDRTQHTLWMIEEGRIFNKIDPQLVVLMIGTNNIGHKAAGPEATIEGIKLCVKALRKAAPNAKILLFGVFPRGALPTNPYRAMIKTINQGIAPLADNKTIFYEDIADKFLDPEGNLPKKVMSDLLHPNAAGYKIWADAIKPYLKRFVK